MSIDPVVPSRAACDVVREEEALFARVVAAIEGARARDLRVRGGEGERPVEELRALREDAKEASEDDLPALLHEIHVRRKLLDRPVEVALPDPSAPYVAHLAVRDARGRRDYLLGHGSFFDAGAGVRIVDWRVAPMAKVFYRYREGEEFEEVFAGREVEGVVIARRVIVFENGALAQIIGDDEVLCRGADGEWIQAARGAFAAGGAETAVRAGVLGTGATGKARAEVTAVLDAQQFAAVSAPPEQALVVLGSAGSGKTTVALHRLAHIAASDPRRFPIARMAVVVPEPGLARLSARLLAPLSEEPPRVRTLDGWSRELSMQVFGAGMPRRVVEAPGLVAALKRSPALYDALRARFAGKGKRLEIKAMRRRLADLFTDRPFLEEVVKASGGALSRASVEATVRHTMLQIAAPIDRMLQDIVVPEMKQAVDGRAIDDGTPDELAGSVDFEELPILLAMRAWRGGIEGPRFAHLVLDEAEDFSLFDLEVLGALLGEPASVTLAGDEAQETSGSFAGWGRAEATLGVREAVTCRLSVSYRCPRPIVEFARRVLGPLAPEEPLQSARDGAPVEVFAFPDDGAVELFLMGALRDLVDREPKASIAVIAHDEESARRMHGVLGEAGARLAIGGALSFEAGIDVIDVDGCKGLEFDYVVVPDATAAAYPRTDVARRRLHVAVTRASHQVWVMAGGKRSVLWE